MDHKVRDGQYIFLSGNYSVTTAFESAGLCIVNYSYRIVDTKTNEVVLSGKGFNPTRLCKTEKEWPRQLGWCGIGELLSGACSFPDSIMMLGSGWLADRSDEEVDWLVSEDAENLQLRGIEIVRACNELTFPI